MAGIYRHPTAPKTWGFLDAPNGWDQNIPFYLSTFLSGTIKYAKNHGPKTIVFTNIFKKPQVFLLTFQVLRMVDSQLPSRFVTAWPKIWLCPVAPTSCLPPPASSAGACRSARCCRPSRGRRSWKRRRPWKRPRALWPRIVSGKQLRKTHHFVVSEKLFGYTNYELFVCVIVYFCWVILGETWTQVQLGYCKVILGFIFQLGNTMINGWFCYAGWFKQKSEERYMHKRKLYL